MESFNITLKSYLEKENIVFIIIFAVIFLFLLYILRFRLSPYDDGVLLYGAQRVLAGDMPYKDFYLIYTPGNLFVLALIFKVFGPLVMIQKISNTIISFFILITAYMLGKKFIKNFYALLLLILLTTIYIWMLGSYAIQSILVLFSLLSVFYLLNYIERSLKQYLIISGVLIGLSILFPHDTGLYTFLLFL